MDVYGTVTAVTASSRRSANLASSDHIIMSGPNTILVIILALISALILVSVIVSVSHKLCWLYITRYLCTNRCRTCYCRWSRCWSRTERCRTSEVEHPVVTGRISSRHSSAITLNPPHYEDALNFPRVDSSTIKGLPPPKYSSLSPILSQGYSRDQSGHDHLPCTHLSKTSDGVITKNNFSSIYADYSSKPTETLQSPLNDCNQTWLQFRCYSDTHFLTTAVSDSNNGSSSNSLDTYLYPVWRQSLSTPNLIRMCNTTTSTRPSTDPDQSDGSRVGSSSDPVTSFVVGSMDLLPANMDL